MGVVEGDEPGTDRSGVDGEAEDNSLGRLLALSDGVFAIAMTLLALDLKVPDLGESTTDDKLGGALYLELPSILTYLLSFYIVASYWISHHQLMRSVVASHPKLLQHTLPLLLLVAALPFPAGLLANYGASAPLALAIYGAVNALASLLLLLLRYDVRRFGLATAPVDPDVDWKADVERWGNAVAFLLCIPAGYLFGPEGLWALFLLVVAGRAPFLWSWWQGRRQPRTAAGQTRW